MGNTQTVSDYLLTALNHKTKELDPPDLLQPMSDPERDLLQGLYEAHQNGGYLEVKETWVSMVKLAIEHFNEDFRELLPGDHPGRWVMETPAITKDSVLPQRELGELEAALELGEMGDAVIFTKLFAQTVKYDPHEKNWYVWAGHSWKRDLEDLTVNMLINIVLATQYEQAAVDLGKQFKVKDDPGATEFNKDIKGRRDKLNERAGKLRTKNRREQIKNHIRSLMIFDGEWDKQPLLLTFENCVVNEATGECFPGQPEHYLRLRSPIRWEGLNARCPLWEKSINAIFGGNTNLTSFMQRLFGYAVSGLNREHILPIFWGAEGRNGKDTIMETLGYILGPLATTASPDVLMMAKPGSGGQATPHIHQLWGVRIAWVNETEENGRLNVNQVKALTGGGKITSRQLHQEQMQFDPTHLLFLITNNKPVIPNGGDAAFWSRLLIVAFDQRFVENPRLDNEHQADKDLKEKLKFEASGIAAWIVRGTIEYLQNGLNPPPEVRAVTEEYQNEEDDTEDFFAQRCELYDGLTVPAMTLFENYKGWGGRLGQRAFGIRATKKFQRKRTNRGNEYLNIRLIGGESHAA